MRSFIIILATISFFITPCTAQTKPKILVPEGFEEVKTGQNNVFLAFRKQGGGYPTFVGTIEGENYGYPSIKENVLSDYRKVGITDVKIVKEENNILLLSYTLNNVNLYSAVSVVKENISSYIFTVTDTNDSVSILLGKIINQSFEDNNSAIRPYYLKVLIFFIIIVLCLIIYRQKMIRQR